MKNATAEALDKLGMPSSWLMPMLEIAARESSFDPNQQNDTSTAYGAYQFLNSTWADTGIAKTSDPLLQAEAALKYVKSRYGTPQEALDHELTQHWY